MLHTVTLCRRAERIKLHSHPTAAAGGQPLQQWQEHWLIPLTLNGHASHDTKTLQNTLNCIAHQHHASTTADPCYGPSQPASRSRSALSSRHQNLLETKSQAEHGPKRNRTVAAASYSSPHWLESMSGYSTRGIVSSYRQWQHQKAAIPQHRRHASDSNANSIPWSDVKQQGSISKRTRPGLNHTF